jgi:acyl-CoA synthetase (AMP-forming)/AMP-acid ligase II
MDARTLKESLKSLSDRLAARGDGSSGPLAAPLGRAKLLPQAASVLVKAGVIAPMPPKDAVDAVRALLARKMTPAAGFVVSAIRYPDEPAIVDERGTLTYGEVHRRTNALANAFGDAGIGPDDGVAIMCRDHRGWVEATIALSKLGANALFFNTQFAGPQLAEVIEREEPAAIVFDAEFADVVGQAKRDLRRWVGWRDDDDEVSDTTLEEAIEHGDPSDVPAPDSVGRTVLLTSGSTGTPKGASRGQPDPIDPVVALLSRIPLRAREPTMFAAPLFHAWGFLQFQIGVLLSTTFVLRRRFDPEATLKAIDENDATALVIVPIMLQRILELDEDTRRRYDTSSLRAVASSGGALSGDLAASWMDAFGDNLYNLYGSTEVAWAAIAGPHDLRAAPGTSGTAPPGTTLKILDEERNERPAGEVGEIFVGNAMLLEGYTGGDEGEEMHEGFMATGDLGRLDENGRLFVEGRADDMIVSGGENVYPEEVEATLAQHERVAEAAVVGVDDEEFGERLKAFVVVEGEISEDDLKSHVKENLANFKVPREIVFMDELPRKQQGKVDKKALEKEHGDGSSSDES